MRWNKISDAVIRRLPLYLRVLDDLAAEGEIELISSQELGDRAGVGPALVRKDLAWFGEFGKQGVGYEVSFLRKELKRILNLDQEIPVALVGIGSLGGALARYHLKRYGEHASPNLNLIALFDTDPNKIGSSINGIPVFPFSEVNKHVEALGIKMAMITVPADQAQEVAVLLTKAGIKGILNFAPVKLNVPSDVQVSNADFSLELQRLAYYLPTTKQN